MKSFFTHIFNWIKDVWSSFKSLFDETTGASMTRFVTFIWVLTLCGNLTFVVLFNILKLAKGQPLSLPDIPGSYITITGVLITAKVSQRIWGENGVTSQIDVNQAATPPVTTPTPPTPPTT